MTITNYQLQWVDSIAAAPTLRLDLNDGATWTVHSDTDFGMPRLSRAIVSTLLADGGQVPASAYGLRLLRIVLTRPAGANEDVDAAALQALFREVDRPTNVLKWQPDVANPVFFRTVRSDSPDVTWDPTLKRVEIEVLAEPFAYGPEENLGTITIGGDPDLTGIHADINAVKGDVETPLILEFPASGTLLAARQAVFSARRSPTPIVNVAVDEAQDMGLGQDSSYQAVGSYSGTGNSCIRTNFSLNPLLTRRGFGNFPMTGPLAAASATELRGTYRVFARVKKSVASDGISVKLCWGNQSPAGVLNTLVALPNTTNIVMVDLGLFHAPYGPDPGENGYSGVDLAVQGTYYEFQAQRTSGSGTLELDYLAFVPASDQLTIINMAPYGATTSQPVWDGPNSTIYKSVSGLGSAVGLWPPPALVGAGALMVSPGMYNRIWGLRDVTPGAATDLNGVTYGVRYYPRYLYVRPVST